MGFEATAAEIGALTPLDLPAIVDTVLDVSPNPVDTPPASLTDANVGDWQKMVDLTQWWLDRMATVPRPLQEKLAFFWHGHFATQVSKVGRAIDMYDQNRLFRTAGLGSFETLVQQMSVQVAMLIYLDNDPNEKGAPNENFARELMELFTLGVNQYTQADVVSAARAWTGHNVDYGAEPRIYRFYPNRHDTDPKPFMGETKNWDGPEIITRILTVEPQRSIAARFIAKKLWTFFAYPNPSSALLDTLTTAFVNSNLDISALLRTMFLAPEFYSNAARQGLVRGPVEWIVACLRATGMTARETNPQWWMEDMGQQLFEPPNVAGWKNNAYWLNSTALWARAGFARNITWKAHEAGFLMEITTRTAQNQYVMSAAQAVDLALTRFGRDPATNSVSPWVRSVLINWLTTQRGSEGAPTYSWRDWAAINLTTMTMLTPDVLLA
ncbi:MAG: DUF1800 domain-containing protein [Acidimicrobiia bacterium]|nr:DUF1800 domain-containing protein [Acidimicrobiia bacterium]